MINIVLHGVLGKKLGRTWLLDVDSVHEIFEAVEANNQKINKYFSDFKKFVSHFVVYVDGKILPPYLLKSKILENGNKVEIIPVVQGGAFISSTAWIVIGLLLIALSINSKDFTTGDEAFRVEQKTLIWLRETKSLGIYLSKSEMPQGGETETVDASEINLPTIWAKVEELSRVKK